MAKLHFYYSAMNAGKSTTLLQSNYNYKERGMETIVFTPSIDDRYGAGIVTSRIGLKANAISVSESMDMYLYTKEYFKKNQNLACILVDEVHLLKHNHIKQLTNIVDSLDIPVLAYGLRSDFRGEPFEGSMYLLILADQIIELKTICHCGKKATMNMLVDANGQKVVAGAQVQIGGNEKYIATCRSHYEKGVSGIVNQKYIASSVDKT
ncbi:MAG: thymidine kinase [Francisellaceae bacterium]|jgi:thymidine kinase|nr:thymidine kinase [Francisellaceae bacterium]MBT6538011.1 thymidine kinase [Francisellaceae bacterium]